MAREKPPPEPPSDIPMWFMTYSDVITLMMTFFILLLTFSTNEPETFEKMKVTLFGGTGSAGVAGHEIDGIRKDSWVMRTRTDAARATMRGTEIPPMEMSTKEAMNGGLQGLETDEVRKLENSLEVQIPGHELGSPEGELYPLGEANLKMLSELMRLRELRLDIHFSNEAHMQRAISICLWLIERGHPQDSISIHYAATSPLEAGKMSLRLKRYSSKTDVQTQKKGP